MPSPHGTKRHLPPDRAESSGRVPRNALRPGHPSRRRIGRKSPGRPARSLHFSPKMTVPPTLVEPPETARQTLQNQQKRENSFRRWDKFLLFGICQISAFSLIGTKTKPLFHHLSHCKYII